jgi:hypothetical protein
MRCIICRFVISKDDRRADEISMWREADGQKHRVKKTGATAHVVCLEGRPYDERQLSMLSKEID